MGEEASMSLVSAVSKGTLSNSSVASPLKDQSARKKQKKVLGGKVIIKIFL